MESPERISQSLESILLKVQKPARYVGGELNAVVKDWDSVVTRTALVFPDIYDIGMPNLGLAILYESLNRRSDVLAERAYSPWIDMEAQMRKNNVPLYGLESKRPLRNFDIIGISLPYETLYTNTLNILDLARIPLFSSERTAEHPLIVAGGHATFNPEPMASFIDAFVIGEGEEVIHEVINAHQEWKRNNGTRPQLLDLLSNIPGVYIPEFFTPQYNTDGTLARMTSSDGKTTDAVIKRINAHLPPSPTKFVVPNIDTVHNRVSIEIMRGCTRGCRFCHAGMIMRPVRERSVSEIMTTIKTALENTGYEEIALLSLSSSDYSDIVPLVDQLQANFIDKNLVISLPSLRIESLSVEILEKIKGNRSSGITLAPEAATDRLRRIINKPITRSQLLETTRDIFTRGWTTIKLYFMIGHPTETMEDVAEIASLCKEVLAVGKKIIGGRATVHAGVGSFVPKPHTPFQWVQSDSTKVLEEKQQLLKQLMRVGGLKLSWTDPDSTLLETWLSRGDRRLSEVIHQAWLAGAKFDSWHEHFSLVYWNLAFVKTGIDPDHYANRKRELEETFPWDHIHTGVTKQYLYDEYQQSLTGTLREDCRDACHACGILSEYRELREKSPGDHWQCPEVS